MYTWLVIVFRLDHVKIKIEKWLIINGCITRTVSKKWILGAKAYFPYIFHGQTQFVGHVCVILLVRTCDTCGPDGPPTPPVDVGVGVGVSWLCLTQLIPQKSGGSLFCSHETWINLMIFGGIFRGIKGHDTPGLSLLPQNLETWDDRNRLGMRARPWRVDDIFIFRPC